MTRTIFFPICPYHIPSFFFCFLSYFNFLHYKQGEDAIAKDAEVSKKNFDVSITRKRERRKKGASDGRVMKKTGIKIEKQKVEKVGADQVELSTKKCYHRDVGVQDMALETRYYTRHHICSDRDRFQKTFPFDTLNNVWHLPIFF